MSAFLFGVGLQWKLDIRNKGIILTYYIVPLLFFAFMGGIFSSIDPTSKESLVQSMTVFGVTMGAILGSPNSLIELYGSEIKKSYKVGGIPLWIPVINNYISAFIHLFLMSVVILFIAPIAFDAKAPESPLVYFIALSIFIITCLGVGTVLGLWVKNISKLTMLSQFIFLPSIMLSGIMFPSSMLPNIFSKLGNIFPATWGYKLMSSEVLSFNLIYPLMLILLVMICLSIYRLIKIGVE